ncbi:MAG: hypothetical protein QG594_215, partial [Bacteroidota bacterium]|nr:hypothetical protein [Bacteroidota bacterium]
LNQSKAAQSEYAIGCVFWEIFLHEFNETKKKVKKDILINFDINNVIIFLKV